MGIDVPVYPSTQVSILYFLPSWRFSGDVVRRTRVPGYPGYDTLFSPLDSLERRRGKQDRYELGYSLFSVVCRGESLEAQPLQCK